MKPRILFFLLLFPVLLSAQNRSDTTRNSGLEKMFLPGAKLAFQYSGTATTLEAGYSHLLVFAPTEICGLPFVGAAATASAEMRWYDDGFAVSPKISVEGNLAFLLMRGAAVYDLRESAHRMRYNAGMGLSIMGYAYALYGFEFPKAGEPARVRGNLELGLNLPLDFFIH